MKTKLLSKVRRRVGIFPVCLGRKGIEYSVCTFNWWGKCTGSITATGYDTALAVQRMLILSLIRKK